MPKAYRSSYNFTFKLKIVAEAEAIENNSEIQRNLYGISESPANIKNSTHQNH